VKALLLQPYTPGTENWTPPLGLGYLGAALELDGIEARIADLNAMPLDAWAGALARVADADVVGITTNMANARKALELGSSFDGRPVVFGGPQASARPEVFLAKPNHYVLRGESERSLALLIRALSGCGSLASVPGLIFRGKDGELRSNPRLPPELHLDNLPMPAWHMFDMARYEVSLLGKPATSLISSRGCPFECYFCYHDYQGKVYRRHSVDRVLREIDLLRDRYGYEAFFFYDDNFTLDVRRLREFCGTVLEQRREILWRCYSRVTVVTAELLDLMRRAGCVEIVFGVESGSQRTLDRVKKKIRVEDSVRAIELCRQASISSKSYLMIGFPWESQEDIEKTIEFMDRLLPSQVMLVIATPFAGTPFEKELLDAGVPLDPDIDITGIAEPAYETKLWTRDDLRRLRDIGYEKIRKARVEHVLGYQWRTPAHWQRQFEQGGGNAAEPNQAEQEYMEALRTSWEQDMPAVRPLQAVLGVTNGCNSHCGYCELWRYGDRSGDPDLGVLARVLQEIRDLGVERVNLSGGEPLLREDLESIVSCGAALGLRMGIITSGIGLTDERLAALRAAGLNFASLSLDTLDPAAYRALRGASPDQALAALEALEREAARAHDFVAAVLTVLSPRSLGGLSDLIERCGRGSLWLQVQPAQPFSKDHEEELNRRGLLLRPEHVEHLRTLFQRFRANHCCLNSPEFLDEILSFAATGKRNQERPCYAGYAVVNIDADLRVKPCWRLDTVGCLAESSLGEIWRSDRFGEARRRMRVGDCDDCLLICHGERVRSIGFLKHGPLS
jgi:radical SAM superfamily enzyme YgiQ (UPF0313 family)/pyruvate-formate lyase-activating enzyme